MSTTYLLWTLFSVVVQGLFAFFEMACVSFHKVRLQYYVSLGTRRALWLNYLLKKPSRLFGTTLIGITAALVFGSECARRFYESLHLDPDWAPLTQVPLVVIFGELAPMFAARRHPEQAAMACVPLMILLARLLSPLTWTFDAISRLIHRAMGKEKEVSLFLSREEVRMAFEERENRENELNATVSQIFQLKNLTAAQLMIPLAKVQMIPSSCTVAEVRQILTAHYTPFLPIYHQFLHHIVAVANARDLLKLEDHKRVIEIAKSAWFVTQDTSILQLLKQFRHNNQNLAIILDASGQASGLLTLDQIFAEIFGEERSSSLPEEGGENHIYLDRTLSGEMTVVDFNRQFQAALPEGEGKTLSELILSRLDHFPAKDESIRIGDLEFTVEEPTLRGIKTLSVHSIPE